MSKKNDRTIAKIAEAAGVSVESVKPETHLVNDLNLDSLDRVEMTMDLEDEFGIEIPDEDAEPLVTVQQVLDYIASRVPVEA